jgi:ABC-type Fe3+ transport system substrate-binding protein
MSQYTKSGAAPAKFVGQGEAAVAIVFSHDIVNEIENNKMPLVLTFPEEGTGYEIGGMALLKGAKNMQAAKLWFDWLFLKPRPCSVYAAYWPNRPWCRTFSTRIARGQSH